MDFDDEEVEDLGMGGQKPGGTQPVDEEIGED